MKFEEARKFMDAMVPMCREDWDASEYALLMLGMTHYWKVTLPPKTNAGNYIFSKEDMDANDWKHFEVKKEEAEVELTDAA